MARALPRPSQVGSRRTARASAYRLHVLIGLAVSLGVVTAAFRVPWDSTPSFVGWGPSPSDAFEVAFSPTEPDPAEPEPDLAGRYRIAPAASDAPPDEGTANEGDAEAPAEGAALPPSEAAPPPELTKLAPILEFADVAPEITGGLGSLYLHIRYPQAAIDQGIQGQLVLRFVVEPDGRASEIVVEKSLHPLCDSAAVRALREVAFAPGRQGGEATRVRMRLPVRFRIVGPGGEPLPDSSLATTEPEL